jgi:uncharacterized Zn finger protein
MGRWDFFDYKPSRPIPARGGIKAQSQRGAFGANWWGKRWIAVLEGFHLGARLSRGKNYARHGQVLSVTVNPGVVTASVQGSRKTPYLVKIGLRAFTPADWKRVTRLLAAQPFLVAKLLAGELPGELEQVFTGADLSLLPERHEDLKTSCSCPDSSNPCKHIAAVYYILGENFDQDPFLIFKLRGQGRQELCELLGASPASDTDPAAASSLQGPGASGTGAGGKRSGRAGRNTQATAAGPAGQDKQSDPFEPGEQAEHSQPAEQAPLPADPGVFWKGNPEPGAPPGTLPVSEMPPAPTATGHPETAAALLRRLGNFPFWQGSEHLLDLLEPLYQQVAESGLALMTGEEREQLPADHRLHR